jgi:hypothetical protein
MSISATKGTAFHQCEWKVVKWSVKALNGVRFVECKFGDGGASLLGALEGQKRPTIPPVFESCSGFDPETKMKLERIGAKVNDRKAPAESGK